MIHFRKIILQYASFRWFKRTIFVKVKKFLSKILTFSLFCTKLYILQETIDKS